MKSTKYVQISDRCDERKSFCSDVLKTKVYHHLRYLGLLPEHMDLFCEESHKSFINQCVSCRGTCITSTSPSVVIKTQDLPSNDIRCSTMVKKRIGETHILWNCMCNFFKASSQSFKKKQALDNTSPRIRSNNFLIRTCMVMSLV